MEKQNNGNELNCNKTSRKVCIIGLDGATFDIMEPLIKNGDLPNIASIMKGGVSAELNSTFFPQSATAWTSFATGKNPGKHSIIGFSKMASNNYKLELVCGSDNKAKTLWEILSEKNKKVIVIGIPMTYPPKPVNGILISGMDAPTVNASSVYPPQMAEEILKIAPYYKTRLYLKGYLHNDKKRIKAMNLIINSIDATAKLVHYLMNNNQWDFFVVRFNSPDNVQHHYWSYLDKNHPKHNPKSPVILKDAINSIYRQLDRIIGQIYKNINKDNTTFIIMSDHGAGPLPDRAVFLNEWLRNMGYLCEIKNNGEKNLIKFLWKSGLFSFLVKVIPPEIKRIMIKKFPPLIQKTAMYFKFQNIDWSKTKAFVSEVDGIRININEKYPQGIVAKEDYEDIRDSIIDGLKYIRDSESRETVFKKVCKKEEVFWGDSVEDFPDIVLRCHEKYKISTKLRNSNLSKGNLVAIEKGWKKVTGGHKQYGICIVNGPDCRSDRKLNTVDITDIFPTVLYQLGIAIPKDVDGKIIKEIFRDDFLKDHPVTWEDTTAYVESKPEYMYNKNEEKKIVESLKELGYMD